MLIKNTSEGNDFPVTPSGLHPAVLYGIVDVGTHEEVWQGEPHDRHSMFLLFELPTLTIEIEGETKPRGISQKYTKSMHPKAALRIMLQNWRGKPFTEHEARQGFDIETIIGQNCQLNIIHNEVGDKTYANIGGVVPLGAGMTKYHPHNPTVCYDISEGANIPPIISDWLKSKIMASLEFNAIGQQNEDPWEENSQVIYGSQPDNEPLQEPMREPGDELDDSDIPF